jgi:hypothetical protein
VNDDFLQDGQLARIHLEKIVNSIIFKYLAFITSYKSMGSGESGDTGETAFATALL